MPNWGLARFTLPDGRGICVNPHQVFAFCADPQHADRTTILCPSGTSVQVAHQFEFVQKALVKAAFFAEEHKQDV